MKSGYDTLITRYIQNMIGKIPIFLHAVIALGRRNIPSLDAMTETLESQILCSALK